MGLPDKAAAVQEPARADYIAGLKGSRQNKRTTRQIVNGAKKRRALRTKGGHLSE
jgi:hypothetical protein